MITTDIDHIDDEMAEFSELDVIVYENAIKLQRSDRFADPKLADSEKTFEIAQCALKIEDLIDLYDNNPKIKEFQLSHTHYLAFVGLLSSSTTLRDPNSSGILQPSPLTLRIPIHYAAACTQIDTYGKALQDIIKLNKEIDPRDIYGNTPLHIACYRGKEQIAKILMNAKANFKAENKRKNTPLHFAVSTSSINIVKLLLEAGADIDAQNSEGNTPLHIAVMLDLSQEAELLLRKGASLEKPNSKGQTPLHLGAVLNKQLKRSVVDLLLEKGANKEALTPEGDSPLDLSARHRNSYLVDLLLKQGAFVTNKSIEKLSELIQVNAAKKPEELSEFERLFRVENDAAHKNILKVLTKNMKMKMKSEKKAEKEVLEKMKLESMAKKKAEAEQLKSSELANYLDEQKQARLKIENDEKEQNEKRAQEKVLKEKNEKKFEGTFNEVFDILSGFKSSKGETKTLFKGGARKTVLETLKSQGMSEELIDRKVLAYQILLKLKLGKGSALLTDLHDQFIGNTSVGLKSNEEEDFDSIGEQINQDPEKAQRDAEESERRKQMNILIYRHLKQHEANASSSSSSSAEKPGRIGFSSEVEANRFRALVLEFFKQVNVISESPSLSNDLYELKYDVIQLSALLSRISTGGGVALVKALIDFNTLWVIRNGAIHLLELNTPEEAQVNFYRSILSKMLEIASLKITQDKLSMGLNKVLKEQIETNQSFPLCFDLKDYQDIYGHFKADCIVWEMEHDAKKRSDVINDIHSRIEMFEKTDPDKLKRKSMLMIEVAELYQQLKNAGSEIPSFAHKLIEVRNRFVHDGTEVKVPVSLNKFKLK